MKQAVGLSLPVIHGDADHHKGRAKDEIQHDDRVIEIPYTHISLEVSRPTVMFPSHFHHSETKKKNPDSESAVHKMVEHTFDLGRVVTID